MLLCDSAYFHVFLKQAWDLSYAWKYKPSLLKLTNSQ